MKVVLTDEALRDLESIGDYIARDDPDRARTFVAELLGKARHIGQFRKDSRSCLAMPISESVVGCTGPT